MALTITNFNDNPFQPGVVGELYIPDQLIAGNEHLVTTTETLAQQTAVLPRGTLLGKVTASGDVTVSKESASDGSQTPYGVLVDTTDATGGAVSCGVYVKGEFNVNFMSIDSSWGATLAAQTAAVLAPCRAATLYLKTPIDANDPTETNAAGV